MDGNSDIVYYFHELYGDPAQTPIRDPFYSVHCPLGLKSTRKTFNIRENQKLLVHNLEIPKQPFFREDRDKVRELWRRKLVAVDIFRVIKPLSNTYFKTGFQKDNKGKERYFGKCKTMIFTKATPEDLYARYYPAYNRLYDQMEGSNSACCNYYNLKHQHCYEARNTVGFYEPSIDKHLTWDKNDTQLASGAESFLRTVNIGKKAAYDDGREYFYLTKEDIEKCPRGKSKVLATIDNGSSPLIYADMTDNSKGVWWNMHKIGKTRLSDSCELAHKPQYGLGMINGKDDPYNMYFTNMKNRNMKDRQIDPWLIDPSRYCMYIFHDGAFKKRTFVPVYDKATTRFDPIYRKKTSGPFGTFLGKWNSRLRDKANFKTSAFNLYFLDFEYSIPIQRLDISSRYYWYWSKFVDNGKLPFDPVNPYCFAIYPWTYSFDSDKHVNWDVIFYGTEIPNMKEGTKIQMFMPKDVALDYITLLSLAKNNTSCPKPSKRSFYDAFNYDCKRFQDADPHDRAALELAVFDTSRVDLTPGEWSEFNGYEQSETKKFQKKVLQDNSKVDLNDFYLVEFLYQGKKLSVGSLDRHFVVETSWEYLWRHRLPTYPSTYLFGFLRQYFLNQQDLSELDPTKYSMTDGRHIHDRYGFSFMHNDLAVHELNRQYLVPYLLQIADVQDLNKFTYFQHYYPKDKNDTVIYRFEPKSRKIGVPNVHYNQEPFAFGYLATLDKRTEKVFTFQKYYDLVSPSPFQLETYAIEYFKKQQWLTDKDYTVPSQNEILLLYCNQVQESIFLGSGTTTYQKFPYIFTSVANLDDNPYHKKGDKYLRLTDKDFRDQKGNNTYFTNVSRIDSLEFYLARFDGSYVQQPKGKVLPFKNFLFTVRSMNKAGSKRRYEEQLEQGRTERFIGISDADDNSVFTIRFADVLKLKEMLGINQANLSRLKYVEFRLLSLTVPLQTKDHNMIDEYMYLFTRLIETAMHEKQTKTYIVNGTEKNVLATFNLGYFKESKAVDPTYPLYLKRPIYFDTPASGVFSNPIYLDNLSTLLDTAIDIRFLNTDEKVTFKSESTTNQIEYSLTPYYFTTTTTTSQ